LESKQKQIPVLDLSAEIDILWDEINTAIQRVLRSGQFILGPDVSDFEEEFAHFQGTKHAIACNSGTDALVIGLRAMGIGAGDEIITTTFSFFATAESISLVGATPIFVDIDPATFNLDASLVEQVISPRTKAILPVHLYGQSADMDRLREIADTHSLLLLEDVAQAFGGMINNQKLGTIGHVGAFSFFPTKNLGAYGDAGLLATNDDQMAETARKLRTHGSRKKYANEILGYNSRMDTLQAAILRVKLPYVPAWNEARREAAHRYDQMLAEMQGVTIPYQTPNVHHVYHQYTIRLSNGRRDTVRQYLAQHGIDTMVYYPTPIHKLPIYAERGYHLPAAESAAAEVLSLPIWPQISADVQQQVVDVLAEAMLVAGNGSD
jgi:dTDP-4-amino-4,6-dideoxygalactose transaminase